MCFECDSVWNMDQTVSDTTGSNFEDLMVGKGLRLDWENVEKLQPSD